MAKYDVFISYSRKNSDIVNIVANRLKKEGLNIWIDEDGIESGDLFKKVITTAIENSACLLFFSSEASNQSQWTAKEIGIAIYEGIPVIPVLLDDTRYNPEIKFDLVNRDFVDMKDSAFHDKSIARIVKSIKNLLKNSSSEIHTRQEEEKTNEASLRNIYKSDFSKIVPDEFKPTSNEQITGHTNIYRQLANHKNTKLLTRSLQKLFSYPYALIILFIALLLLCGVIGLLLYPFILIIYFEIRKKRNLTVPAFYTKYRKPLAVIAAICTVVFATALLYLHTYIFSGKKTGDRQENDTLIYDEITYSSPDIERDDSIVSIDDNATPALSNHAETINLTGKSADKNMTLSMKPSGMNQIDIELDIDGVKFSPSYTTYLHRSTLRADLDNADGTFIGTLDGIITIENGIIVYKGEASSQGKTPLFKDGKFEFKGKANETILQMIKTQTKNSSFIETANPSDFIILNGKSANKEMTLCLKPFGKNQIDVELEIDRVKFSPSYTTYFHRRTLRVDFDNTDGTFIGSFDGIITIENDMIIYKGDASSQGKTPLFKDGKFEFKGKANKSIIQMIENKNGN